MRSRPHMALPACMHAGMRGEDHEQFLLEAPWQPFAVLSAWLALTPGEILRVLSPSMWARRLRASGAYFAIRPLIEFQTSCGQGCSG